jgi:hypothetical protein
MPAAQAQASGGACLGRAAQVATTALKSALSVAFLLWWTLLAPRLFSVVAEGEEALVEEPAHGGQLVRVVQGAPGVPHGRAPGSAASCSSLRQLVMLPRRHDQAY